MRSIVQSGWRQWNPSASDKESPNSEAQPVLLRADNLTKDEIGNWRLARAPRLEATNQFPSSDIYTLFSTTLNGIKTRFVYANQGTNKAILCTTTDPRSFGTTLITAAETVQKCAFLNAMGQVIMCAGATQRKYDGTNNFTLGIPAPSPPTNPTTPATNSVDLSNLDGSSNYTNWSSVTSATYDDTGTNINGTATDVPSKIAKIFAFKTVFGSDKDTTNLGGAGKDTPDDLFTFNLKVTDATQLVWLQVTLYCAVTPSPQNYFWKYWQWDQGPDSPYAPFEISSDVTTVVAVRRSDFFRVGDSTVKGWDTIKEIHVEVGISTPADAAATATITWDTFKVKGGTESLLTGTYKYRAVQVNNTGGYIQFSPSSTDLSVEAAAASITIRPAGAVDAQCNEYWLFRQDPEGGLYYFVNKQTGARGFTPTDYLDFRLLEDLLIDANINPLYTMQYYRTALPSTVKGMIWFRDRVIYLTSVGFIPSFKLDPGSYDSRFVYELCGTTSESTLFITKLDVGTFIVATTKDFYRVTGTFGTITDPYDDAVSLLDVTITPLGVSDPAVSGTFQEYQGSIFYVSATGIRILTNATSVLVNDQLDLLFRGEVRNDLPPIKLLPNDQSVIAAASQGNRIYWSLPHEDNINRTYVLTIYQELGRDWRLITFGDNNTNPISMCREDDGTIIFGARADKLNYVRSMESSQLNDYYYPVKVQTQFSYCGNPVVRKDALGFKCKVNTGNNNASLVILGLNYDGSVSRTTIQFSTQGDAILELDIKEQTLNGQKLTVGVPPALAYAVEIGCLTNIFYLQWLSFTIEERPAGVRRVIMYSTAFDKSGRKRIATWPFRANPMGLLSNTVTTLSAYMKVDGVTQAVQTFTGDDTDQIQTFFWNAIPTETLWGVDWELEIVGDEEFEFEKFLAPDITQETPNKSVQEISPASNFGDPGRKRLGCWPFRANLLGLTATAYLRADGVLQDLQTFTSTSSDEIDTFLVQGPDDTLAVDWELEIRELSGDGMEFYGFLDPVFTQKCPPVIQQAINPATNFGTAGRKKIGNWPVRVNRRGHTLTLNLKADGVDQYEFTYTPSFNDEIQTVEYFPPKDLWATDWELKATCDSGMEFYEFLQPLVIDSLPPSTKFAVQPYTNFGKPNLKKVVSWPFVCDPNGATLQIRVSVDGTTLNPAEFTGSRWGTYTWYNTQDIYGVDWRIEVYSQQGNTQASEFEFSKFLAPEVIHMKPVAKKIDQVGPLPLNASGLVYGARFRVSGTSILHYKVYANDVMEFEEDILLNAADNVYIKKFPKGIDTSVCKILLSSDAVFYRYSVELDVRLTGKEGEGKYIMVPDATLGK